MPLLGAADLVTLLDAYVAAARWNSYIRGIDSTSSWHEEEEVDEETPRVSLLARLESLLTVPQPTPAALRETMIIHLDDRAIDVVAHYRGRGFAELPPTPTMTGFEIRQYYSLYDRFLWLSDPPHDREIADGEAVPLIDGMHFYSVPRGTYG